MPPNMHWKNAAEQAIQTFKNQFIAGIFSVNTDSPLQLWDRLLDQATNNMNLMCKYIINPNIYAMNNSLTYSASIAHHFHTQEQESWSITILKRYQHIIPMDLIDGKWAEHHYTTDTSNVTWQAPKLKELQTQLTSFLTILTFSKFHQQMNQQLQNQNLSVPYKTQHRIHHSKFKNLQYLTSKTIRKFQICSTTIWYSTPTAR